MKKLRLIAKVWKVLRKTSLIELILVKLHAAVYYSTIKRLHHRLFLEYVPTTACPKKCVEKKFYGEPTFK